jgi:hypothetical protein
MGQNITPIIKVIEQNQDDITWLSKTLHDVINEILAGDDKTNVGLSTLQEGLKEFISKHE